MPNTRGSSEPNGPRTQSDPFKGSSLKEIWDDPATWAPGPVVTRMSDVKPAAPATRLHRRTLELGLIRERDGKEVYFVDLERCDTPEKLLSWCLHLCGKSFVTRRHIKELIRAAEETQGVRIDYNA